MWKNPRPVQRLILFIISILAVSLAGVFGIARLNAQAPELACKHNRTGVIRIAESCDDRWTSIPFWQSNGNTLYYNSGNVGLGTAGPLANLHVAGGLRVDGDIVRSGGWGVTLGGGLAPERVQVGELNGKSGIWGLDGLKLGSNEQLVEVEPDLYVGGNIGVGTTSPSARLHVNGDVRYTGQLNKLDVASNGAAIVRASDLEFGHPDRRGTPGRAIVDRSPRGLPTELDINFDNDWDNTAIGGRRVLIGEFSDADRGRNDVRLFVRGNVRVYDGGFIDDGTTLNVPDYVFENEYQMPTLEQLRDYVAREKHLPNVPSAAEIQENGLNLGEFQMRLLEKTEELVLYTLQQEDKIVEQQTRITELESLIESMNQRLAALEGR